MSACGLCLQSSEAASLGRVSGVDVCLSCRTADPTRVLQERGIASEWDDSLMRFSAGLGISGLPGDFRMRCVPELLAHKAAKLFVHEVEVGDPVFDRAVFVRTSDPEHAAAVLAPEGVQSALLALLSGLRHNDLMPNHVTLDGATLTVSIRPLGGLDGETFQRLKLETAVLALHLADGRPRTAS